MKDDNRLWKNFIALLFLIALWTRFLTAVRWLWIRLEDCGPFERTSPFLVPGCVMIGLMIGWFEQFLPFRGVIIVGPGRLILAFASIIRIHCVIAFSLRNGYIRMF